MLALFYNTIYIWILVLMCQVGCGAIGCEMLKNYAMIGIGTGPQGKVGTHRAHIVQVMTCLEP